ncbi:uncharacterized protein DNG_05226 [Cephalotrichum gorgonifer]|uniref:Uncharacterized protein n=1 Tax=Cephalotrichum gorgonifer TaxID=2041049 RepID=A0AAE8MZJ0_9PEZI|nr:uncharacterized protein DNG_05226 [Cephalotrichum gorgonifer]
MTSPFQVRVE